MADLELSIPLVVRTLEDNSLLAEAMFFPEVSCYGNKLPKLRSQLSAHLRKLLEEEAPENIYRRRPAGKPKVIAVEVTLEPPKRSRKKDDERSLVSSRGIWSDPLTLHFHVLQWKHSDQAHLAFVPALGIDVIAPTEDELAKRLPRHIRFALMRSGAATDLFALAQLQRSTDVDLESVDLLIETKSPKRRAIEESKEKATKPIIEEVGTDLTRQPLAPAWEMQSVVAQIADAIGGRHPRSVLLVGNSGVGKSAAVRELVRTRAAHELERTPFWETSGARLVAGMSGFGMWQDRCRRLCAEASKAKAILCLGNLMELLEVGKSTHNAQGIASFLRPYLGRGEILAIAEATPQQINIIERADPHLLEIFHRIEVPEPDPQTSRVILLNFLLYEKQHGPPLMDEEGLETLDQLHRRYATYSAFPGRPIRFLRNLLQDWKRHKSAESCVLSAESATNSAPSTRHSALPIGRREIIAAFSRETGLPLFMLDESVPLDLQETRRRFARRVIGQEPAIDLVVDLIATVKAALSRPRRPIASLLFIGPTGVGKTEMAKAIAEFFFSDADRLARFDMSEFATPAAVERLVGGSFATEGLLTAKVREQPFSVVLLDEFEKAHPAFFDLMLQVLGEGRLTDAAGRAADFSNAVVIMTSNLGAASFQQAPFGLGGGKSRDQSAHFLEEVREFLRPEMFNRIDRVVPFSALGPEIVLQIARREIELIKSRDGMRLREVELDIPDDAVNFLAAKGFDALYGARPLKRAIERQLLAPLSDGLNSYGAGHKLIATATVERQDGNERLAVSVRTATASGGAVGGTLAGPLAGLAMEAATLRRGMQRLRQSSSTLAIENEIYSLHRLRERLAARMARMKKRKSGSTFKEEPFVFVDDERLARLRRLEPVAAALKAFEERIIALENDLLQTLYQPAAASNEQFTERLAAANRDWDQLLLSVYALRFAHPDRVTILIRGDANKQFDLMAAYVAQATNRGHTADFYWMTLSGADKLAAHRVEKLAQLRTEPRKTYALATVISGENAFCRFGPEHGLHVFVEEKKEGPKLNVLTHDGAIGQSRPLTPDEIQNGLPERRRYDLDVGFVKDARLKRQLRFTGNDWPEALARSIDEQLWEAARAVIDA